MVCRTICVLASVAALVRTADGSLQLRHSSGRVEHPDKAAPSHPQTQQSVFDANGILIKGALSLQQKQLLLTQSNDIVTKKGFTAEKSSQAPVMPIESFMMGMTPDQIQHMYAEMTVAGGAVSQANNFVRSHPNEGWTWCGNAGDTCWCNGQARFGAHEGGWPSFTNPIPVTGSVACNAGTFASTFAYRNAFHCQCQDTSEKAWQNTKLRFNSKSYLQEAWISLTRVLAQAKLLPFNGGDRSFGGEELFGSRGSGDQFRLYMDIFLKENAPLLPQHPVNCIEWGPMAYMPQFPACATPTSQYVLDFEADPTKMHVDANRHVHCNNVKLPQCMGATTFQVAISTNVWEHEQDPFEAMQSLYNVMNPGAVMIFTVPFIAPYHGVPFDFYRYTKAGALHLLTRAGWCVPKSRMAGGGSFIGDIAMFSGMGPGDFSAPEMLQDYHRGYDAIPDGPIVLMAVATKKLNPTDACPV